MSGRLPLASFDVVFTAELIQRYGGPGRHLHADEGIARSLGFPALVSWGTLTVLPFSELLERVCGQALEQGGKLAVRLSRPVCAGDTVTYAAFEGCATSDGASTSLSLTATCARTGVVASAQATLPRLPASTTKGTTLP